MEETAFQDKLTGFWQHCFGCGSTNHQGLRIRSHWDGEEGVCHWTPEAHHCAGPEFMNGGIIATLIDCHMGCTVSATAYKAEGREIGSAPGLFFVTATMTVDYLKPTPMEPVELRARVTLQGRKATSECALYVGGVKTARGTGVFVQVPG